MKGFQLFIKRLFDIVVSFIMIVVLTVIPVFIVVPILIKLTSKGPVVFKQERIGKNGKPFNIYKFRTMTVLPEGITNVGGLLYKPNGEILTDYENRTTKIGKILRKTSLDELMQLFNILNGTMSFVGPRPIIPHRLDKMTDEQKKRHLVRPGVTGWAQVHGRNNLTWEEKYKYDLDYVENFSLWMDIKVYFKTVTTVLRKKGVAYYVDADLKANRTEPDDKGDKA